MQESLIPVSPNSIRKLQNVLNHIGIKMIDLTGASIRDEIKGYTFTIHPDIKEKGKFGDKSGVFFVFDETGHPWSCVTPDDKEKLENALKISGYKFSPSAHPMENIKNAKIDGKIIWNILPDNKPKTEEPVESNVVESCFEKWLRNKMG